VTREMGLETYPMESFRPNIVVQTGGAAWSEETWCEFGVGTTEEQGSIPFRKLKNTPRCIVPARDQQTGGWAHTANKALVQKTIRKMFPTKCKDSEWGTEWEGPMFGIHVAYGGVIGTVHVGDAIQVTKRGPMWREPLGESVMRAVRGWIHRGEQRQFNSKLQLAAAVAIVLAALLLAYITNAR